MSQLASNTVPEANGRAVTTKSFFSRETAVAIFIQADKEVIWNLLTDAANFPQWNTTVVSLSGDIALGEKIQLKSILDEKRVFTLEIKEMIPGKKLVWGDNQGNREYTLAETADGVVFQMEEKIGGLFFPLYGRFIPPFDEAFEQFAADIKQEAERIQA